MKQILKVRTADFDQYEGGPEYRVHYFLNEMEPEEIFPMDDAKYAIYVGDDEGFASEVATGNSLKLMRSLVLSLGEFVEWGEAKVPA